jgi:hypothetical protein
MCFLLSVKTEIFVLLHHKFISILQMHPLLRKEKVVFSCSKLKKMHRRKFCEAAFVFNKNKWTFCYKTD